MTRDPSEVGALWRRVGPDGLPRYEGRLADGRRIVGEVNPARARNPKAPDLLLRLAGDARGRADGEGRRPPLLPAERWVTISLDTVVRECYV